MSALSAPRALGLLHSWAGRFGWLLWIALIPWVLAALGSHLWYHMTLGPGPHYGYQRTVLPARVLFVSVMIVIVLLWRLKAPRALAAGYNRRTVFWGTLAFTAVLSIAYFGIALTATFIETATSGETPWRVFQMVDETLVEWRSLSDVSLYWRISLVGSFVVSLSLLTVVSVAWLRYGMWGAVKTVMTLVLLVSTAFAVLFGASVLFYPVTHGASWEVSEGILTVLRGQFIFNIIIGPIVVAAHMFSEVRA